MAEEIIKFELNGQEHIQLNSLLKFLGLVNSGGEAKMMIKNGEVIVDGEVEYRLRNKLRDGAVVSFQEKEIRIVNSQSEIKSKQMTEQELHDLKYPVGKFTEPENYTDSSRASDLEAIRNLPTKLREAVEGLDDTMLDVPYRVGAWCTRQIVHHLADSHMNSFIRFKLALTEDNPTIKPYDQDAWAKGTDAKLPIEHSLAILDGVHARLANVMENMSAEDYSRTLHHPEWERDLPLDMMGALYGWHSVHHLTQITELRKRRGW